MTTSACGNADNSAPPNRLLGCWKLVSYRSRNVNDNTERDIYGQNPKGYYIFTERRLMVLFSPSERSYPQSEAEAAAMLSSLTAYTANYVVDDEKFVFTPDVSHNEFYVGKEQIRYYKIDGDRLRLHTDVMTYANDPHNRIIGAIEFVREK